MLEHMMNLIVPIIIHILELIGVFIIIFSALKTFIKYALRWFNFEDETFKIQLSQSLAMALEFKLAAEILKTLMVRTIEELIIVASIVVLRAVLTFIIHWEMESDSKRGQHLSKVHE